MNNHKLYTYKDETNNKTRGKKNAWTTQRYKEHMK